MGNEKEKVVAAEDRVKLTVYTKNAGYFIRVMSRSEAEEVVEDWEKSMDLGCLTISSRIADVDFNPSVQTIRREEIVSVDIMDINSAF